MAMGRWSSYQLSRLELVFAIIVLLVIFSVILNRALVYLAIAERAFVDTTVMNINSALQIHAMQKYVDTGQRGLAELQDMNPVGLVGRQPEQMPGVEGGIEQFTSILEQRLRKPMHGYQGEFDEPDLKQMTPGSWYFDSREGVLVYMVRNRELFRSSLEGPARIRYRVIIDYVDRTGDDRFDPRRDEYRGVRLQPVDEYQWLF